MAPSPIAIEVEGDLIPAGKFDESDLSSIKNWAITRVGAYEVTDVQANEIVSAITGSGSAAAGNWVQARNSLIRDELVLRVRLRDGTVIATPKLP